MIFGLSLSELILRFACILICLTIHEFSHGLMAYFLGDDTARLQGRLSLNPLDHLDPFGTLMLLIAGFGFAKPVQVNPYKLTKVKTRRAGMALVALAGPLSNLLLALVAMLIYVPLSLSSTAYSTVGGGIILFLISLTSMNIGLAAFNLVPVPPLDGSKILWPYMPKKAAEFVDKNSQVIWFIFIAIVLFGFADGLLGRLQGILFNGIFNIVVGFYSLIGVI